MTMRCDDVGTNVVQRFEVFSGAGRRREWPAEVKAAIIAESYSGHETVCAVARRHGLAPNQLFTWRRRLREQFEGAGVPPSMPSSFVPAVIDRASDPGLSASHRRSMTGAVELEIEGVAVKGDPNAIADVIAVLGTRR